MDKILTDLQNYYLAWSDLESIKKCQKSLECAYCGSLTMIVLDTACDAYARLYASPGAAKYAPQDALRGYAQGFLAGFSNYLILDDLDESVKKV